VNRISVLVPGPWCYRQYRSTPSTTFVPFHLSTLTFDRGNSGISPKCHTIRVDQSVSYLYLHTIKSGCFGLNLQIRALRSKSSFYCLKQKITTSASFPYIVHAHGSWWPCNRWGGSCSWGQCKERTHGWHHMMHRSDTTDLGEPKVGKRGTIFSCDTVTAVICMSHVCPTLP
jgi:hypothetical protein